MFVLLLLLLFCFACLFALFCFGVLICFVCLFCCCCCCFVCVLFVCLFLTNWSIRVLGFFVCVRRYTNEYLPTVTIQNVHISVQTISTDSHKFTIRVAKRVWGQRYVSANWHDYLAGIFLQQGCSVTTNLRLPLGIIWSISK